MLIFVYHIDKLIKDNLVSFFKRTLFVSFVLEERNLHE